MRIDFEPHRDHLRGVAYRMLGSLAEADDALQEAWLRLDRAPATDAIANPRGWLTTVVARICLDMLRARSSRREEAPEGASTAAAPNDTAQELELAESVGLAVLVVLDKLDPAERIAFVLHDLSGLPFEDIAEILARTPEATRQLASRARRRVAGSPPPPEVDLGAQRDTVLAFIAALRRGDVEGMVAVLDPEVVGRAVDPTGAVREVRGARKWASGAVAFAQFANRMGAAIIDGSVGIINAPNGKLVRALRFTFDAQGRIASAEVISDRTRLDALDITALA